MIWQAIKWGKKLLFLPELISGISGGGRNFSTFWFGFCFLAEVRKDINCKFAWKIFNRLKLNHFRCVFFLLIVWEEAYLICLIKLKLPYCLGLHHVLRMPLSPDYDARCRLHAVVQCYSLVQVLDDRAHLSLGKRLHCRWNARNVLPGSHSGHGMDEYLIYRCRHWRKRYRKWS